ncbi:MAG TPA: hypothetical protein VKA91_05810 [Nitrososphaeraceae archaeon]|nr:hypothetical protein [Nitrososphaeraceae archaeon]
MIEGPGTIEQFQAGIYAAGDDGTVISGMNLEDNQSQFSQLVQKACKQCKMNSPIIVLEWHRIQVTVLS